MLGFVTEAFDRSQKLVSGLGPSDGLQVSVVQVDENADVGPELPDGGVNTSLDLFSGEFSEPAFDLSGDHPTRQASRVEVRRSLARRG